jgi:hypothetical protein
MTFTVASNSFKDGDYLPSDFILSSDFGFGCAGGNKSPHLKWRARHRRRKILPSRATTPMRRLARASGTGWWSTSRRMLVNSPKALVARAARCLRARCRHAPISAHPAMAGRARRKATIRTGICSRYLP